MTAPSSYTMQILWPSVFQLIPLTTDLFLLLIISSYHEPWTGEVIEIEIYGLCRTYLVKHPYYDQSILIRRCQFLVRLVPCYHLDLPLVTLKSLIH